MATVTSAGRSSASGTIVTLVAADGTASAAWPVALIGPAVPLRDLADAVHTLCALHATAPGMIDLARGANGAAPVQDALDLAAASFADERAALVALTAAVGPLPSTPGQAECESTVLAQRHALTMLARSDRTGCAIGAASAFLLDWRAVRPILDVAGAAGRVQPAARPDARCGVGRCNARDRRAQSRRRTCDGLWCAAIARPASRSLATPRRARIGTKRPLALTRFVPLSPNPVFERYGKWA